MGIILNKIRYEKEKLIKKINNSSTQWLRQPSVIDMGATISAIRTRKASIARYGDGEFDIIFGRTEGFQKKDLELSNRLREILKKEDTGQWMPDILTWNMNG